MLKHPSCWGKRLAQAKASADFCRLAPSAAPGEKTPAGAATIAGGARQGER